MSLSRRRKSSKRNTSRSRYTTIWPGCDDSQAFKFGLSAALFHLSSWLSRPGLLADLHYSAGVQWMTTEWNGESGVDAKTREWEEEKNHDMETLFSGNRNHDLLEKNSHGNGVVHMDMQEENIEKEPGLPNAKQAGRLAATGMFENDENRYLIADLTANSTMLVRAVHVRRVAHYMQQRNDAHELFKFVSQGKAARINTGTVVSKLQAIFKETAE